MADSEEPKKDEQPAADKPAETPAAGQPAPEGSGDPKKQAEDALEKPTEEGEDGVIDATNIADKDKPPAPAKKQSALKKFFHKVDIYLLGFIFILVITAVVGVVGYLNSSKAPKAANVATQELTQNALKALANSNASIGNSAQTLTVQGNAIFSGQVLIRSDLNVAGNIQLGGTLTVPNLTVTGTSNLASTQASSLQVANGLIVQGASTLSTLNVSGTSSFGGAITASQITATKIVISGNGQLTVPNHLAFVGPSPARDSINQTVLGSGGTSSVNGSDTSGIVNISTGNSPTSGCFIAITFNQPFTSTPHIMLSPIDLGAGETQYYATITTTGFSVCAANTPPGNVVFAYDYLITD